MRIHARAGGFWDDTHYEYDLTLPLGRLTVTSRTRIRADAGVSFDTQESSVVASQADVDAILQAIGSLKPTSDPTLCVADGADVALVVSDRTAETVYYDSSQSCMATGHSNARAVHRLASVVCSLHAVAGQDPQKCPSE